MPRSRGGRDTPPLTLNPKLLPPVTLPACRAGEDAIRHLYSRGTHREFGYAAILCMLVPYFVGAAWTGECSVPACLLLVSEAMSVGFGRCRSGVGGLTPRLTLTHVAVPATLRFCPCPPAAGSAISSGVFVPMLLIGSCIGRLVGLAAVDIAAAHGLGSQGWVRGGRGWVGAALRCVASTCNANVPPPHACVARTRASTALHL